MAHPYLFKRNGWYYLRIRIPKDLISHFSRKELWKSLRTKCYKTAKLSSNKCVQELEQIFFTTRYKMLSLPDFKTIAHLNSLAEEEAREYLLAMETMRNAPDFKLSDEQLLEYSIAQQNCYRDILKSRDYGDLEPVVEEFKRKKDIKIEKGSSEYAVLSRSLVTALIKALDIEIERCKGNYDNDFDKMLSPDITRDLDSVLYGGSQVSTVTAAKTSPLLSEVIDQFLEDRDHITEKTKKEYTGHKPFILKLLGDKQIHTYTRQDFIDSREALKKYPKKANSIPTLENVPINDILKRTDLGPPLAETTRLKYLTFLASIFKFAHEEAHHIEKNLCPAPKKSKELRRSKGTLSWTPEELTLLFQSSYYSDAKMRIKKPYNYWVPLIALYAGLRIDECCQLYVSDIIKIDDIWCIDVNDYDDKKVKTDKSIRQVPIHSKLIELGFLQYVEQCKGDRLWQGLEKGPNGYSHNYGKSFGKYKKRLAIDHENKVFHSFRVNFANAIKCHGKKDEIAGDLLGHARSNEVTAGYTGQTPTQFRKTIVELIDHGVDPLNHITPWPTTVV